MVEKTTKAYKFSVKLLLRRRRQMKIINVVLLLTLLVSCKYTSNPIENNSNLAQDSERSPSGPTSGQSSESSEADTNVYYETDVKPLFEKSCLPCHGAGNPKNWMDYETVKKYTKEILGSIKHSGNYMDMPMGRAKLSDADIELVEEWIRLGMLKESSTIIPSPQKPVDPSPAPNPEGDDEEGPLPTPEESPIKIGEGLFKSNCINCHGDAQKYPGLKGQNKEYIKKQINDFKSGKRSNPNMSFYANDIINDQKNIDFVAEYLSELKPCYGEAQKVEIVLDPTDVSPNAAKGKDIFETQCVFCHTRGNTMNNPNIIGLNGNYVVKTLWDLKTNFRPSTAMGAVLMSFSRQDVLDVAAYISGESECKEE